MKRKHLVCLVMALMLTLSPAVTVFAEGGGAPELGSAGSIGTDPALNWSVGASGTSVYLGGIASKCGGGAGMPDSYSSGISQAGIGAGGSGGGTEPVISAGSIGNSSNDTVNFAAVGLSGTILTSSDGRTWTSRASGTTDWLWTITYGQGMFVAVGGNGISSSVVLTSTDGKTWSKQNAGVAKMLYGVSYCNGTFIATGLMGTILTSTDGKTWTNRATGSLNNLYGVAYGTAAGSSNISQGSSGIYAAVGMSGTILTSSDGKTWASRTSGTTNNLNAIAYYDGMFVAVGDKGTILTSFDGNSWASRASGVTGALKGVTFGGGAFLAVGDSGTILKSSGGISWQKQTVSTANILSSAAYGSGTFVIAGANGTILCSLNPNAQSGAAPPIPEEDTPEVSGSTNVAATGTAAASANTTFGAVKTQAVPGEVITIHYENAPADPNTWIGVFKAEDTSGIPLIRNTLWGNPKGDYSMFAPIGAGKYCFRIYNGLDQLKVQSGVFEVIAASKASPYSPNKTPSHILPVVPGELSGAEQLQILPSDLPPIEMILP